MDNKEEQLEEGIAFAHQGKLKEARAIFEILAKDPSAAHLHIDSNFLLGRTLLDLDLLEESKAALKVALSLVPEEAVEGKESIQQVLDSVELLLGLNPEERIALKKADSINAKGTSFAQTGDFREALEFFNEALKVRPQHEGALSNKCRCLVSLRRYDEALEVARKRVEYYPNSAGGHVNLGYILEEQDKFEEAVAEYECALALEPDNRLAKKGRKIASRKHLYSVMPNVSVVKVSGNMQGGFTDDDLASISKAMDDLTTKSN